MYSLKAVFHGDSITPAVNQSNRYSTARVMSFGKRTTSAKVGHEQVFFQFQLSVRPSATASAGCSGWSTVPNMKCKAVTAVVVACWHAKGLGTSVTSPYSTV
jgi:hypothetical protein